MERRCVYCNIDFESSIGGSLTKKNFACSQCLFENDKWKEWWDKKKRV